MPQRRPQPLAKPGTERDDSIEQLYRRPGFMIRRAHQIAVSVFLEETRELRITTTQYGILMLLADRPGIDQVTVAKLLGLDRSTTSMVIKKLEQEGLIGRAAGLEDRRRRSLRMTAKGQLTLRALKLPAQRARTRLLSVFDPAEREVFLRLLDQFTRAFNESTRVPLEEGQRLPETTPGGRARHE
jgi:DNA-binding MarR family transcriptional regulator